MEQYRLLAEFLLPEHMLDLFEFANVHVEIKDDTKFGQIYLDESFF